MNKEKSFRTEQRGVRNLRLVENLRFLAALEMTLLISGVWDSGQPGMTDQKACHFEWSNAE
ncbi:MAG: hypothetical protein SFU91_11585 [Chloroherpetonaceae bacterium]|nr:hypothetical protein [Chloroherpetonaceae bacterium]